MKKEFETPILDIQELTVKDVITTSNVGKETADDMWG